jgi:hypothetical protein
MPGTITLSQGERLSLLATAKQNGTAITLDSSWLVGAAIMPNGQSSPVDMAAAIVLGKVSIDFDTADLKPGTHVMDIRFTNPESRDQWSQTIKVVIDRTVTPYSPR